MYYKEFVLLRRGLLVFFAIVLVFSITFDATMHASHDKIVYPLPELTLFFMAWLVGIFAAIYGTSLGQDSGDTARLALMRPISRLRAAATVFGMGAGAVVLALFVGSAVFYLPFVVTNGFGAIGIDRAYGAVQFLLPLSLAFAFYGVAAAASVLARRSLAVALMAWPVSAVLFMFIAQPGSLGNVMRDLNVVNPLAYYIAGINVMSNPKLAHHNYGYFGDLTPQTDAVVLFGMFLIFITIAALQWRRVEA